LIDGTAGLSYCFLLYQIGRGGEVRTRSIDHHATKFFLGEWTIEILLVASEPSTVVTVFRSVKSVLVTSIFRWQLVIWVLSINLINPINIASKEHVSNLSRPPHSPPALSIQHLPSSNHLLISVVPPPPPTEHKNLVNLPPSLGQVQLFWLYGDAHFCYRNYHLRWARFWALSIIWIRPLCFLKFPLFGRARPASALSIIRICQLFFT
jgi:hypothetical protein